MSPVSPTVPYFTISKLITTPVHIGCILSESLISYHRVTVRLIDRKGYKLTLRSMGLPSCARLFSILLFIHNTQYAVTLHLTTTIYIAIYFFFYNLAQRTMSALNYVATAILRSAPKWRRPGGTCEMAAASSANLSRQRPVARYTTEHSLYPSSSP